MGILTIDPSPPVIGLPALGLFGTYGSGVFALSASSIPSPVRSSNPPLEKIVALVDASVPRIWNVNCSAGSFLSSSKIPTTTCAVLSTILNDPAVVPPTKSLESTSPIIIQLNSVRSGIFVLVTVKMMSSPSIYASLSLVTEIVGSSTAFSGLSGNIVDS